MLRTLLTIVFVVLCIGMVAVVLLQEGKASGLSALIGASESHWAKNKGRTLEGKMEKFTKIAAVLIFVLALVLNLNF